MALVLGTQRTRSAEFTRSCDPQTRASIPWQVTGGDIKIYCAEAECGLLLGGQRIEADMNQSSDASQYIDAILYSSYGDCRNRSDESP